MGQKTEIILKEMNACSLLMTRGDNVYVQNKKNKNEKNTKQGQGIHGPLQKLEVGSGAREG